LRGVKFEVGRGWNGSLPGIEGMGVSWRRCVVKFEE
jgi:hypothetical protein